MLSFILLYLLVYTPSKTYDAQYHTHTCINDLCYTLIRVCISRRFQGHIPRVVDLDKHITRTVCTIYIRGFSYEYANSLACRSAERPVGVPHPRSRSGRTSAGVAAGLTRVRVRVRARAAARRVEDDAGHRPLALALHSALCNPRPQSAPALEN